jgi:hypothetical protein
MKKVMLMFFLATMAGGVFAMDSVAANDQQPQTASQFEMKSIPLNEENGPTDCTIAVRGQLSLPGAAFDITCTVTRTSCEEATRAARDCVKAMTTALKRDMQF